MPRRSDAHLAMRRDQVLQAALRCFGREGFHATTMQHVITESGLSAGAVYRYFPSKNSLVVAVGTRVLDAARHALSSMAERPAEVAPQDVVPALVARVLDSLDQPDGPDLMRVVLPVWAEALRDEELAALAAELYGGVRESMRRLAQRWVEEGVLRSDADPAAVSRVLFALIPGFVVQRLLLGDVVPDDLRRGLGDLMAAR